MNKTIAANELADMLTRTASPRLKVVASSDRTERDARHQEAQRKIEAALLLLRQGKFNLAHQRTEEATRLLRGVQLIGFDPADEPDDDEMSGCNGDAGE